MITSVNYFPPVYGPMPYSDEEKIIVIKDFHNFCSELCERFNLEFSWNAEENLKRKNRSFRVYREENKIVMTTFSFWSISWEMKIESIISAIHLPEFQAAKKEIAGLPSRNKQFSLDFSISPAEEKPEEFDNRQTKINAALGKLAGMEKWEYPLPTWGNFFPKSTEFQIAIFKSTKEIAEKILNAAEIHSQVILRTDQSSFICREKKGNIEISAINIYLKPWQEFWREFANAAAKVYIDEKSGGKKVSSQQKNVWLKKFGLR